MTSLRFIKPLDKIELGVAEIINGNIDYQFRPVGPDFEGLSNGLNVMLARLLGREEPNEDEPEEEQDETSRWRSDQMLVEEGVGPARPRRRPTRPRSGRRASRSTSRASSTSTSPRCKSAGQADQGDHGPGLHREAAPHRGRAEAEVEGCRMVRFKVNTQGAAGRRSSRSRSTERGGLCALARAHPAVAEVCRRGGAAPPGGISTAAKSVAGRKIGRRKSVGVRLGRG